MSLCVSYSLSASVTSHPLGVHLSYSLSWPLIVICLCRCVFNSFCAWLWLLLTLPLSLPSPLMSMYLSHNDLQPCFLSAFMLFFFLSTPICHCLILFCVLSQRGCSCVCVCLLLIISVTASVSFFPLSFV